MRPKDTFSVPEVARLLGVEIIDVVEAIRAGEFTGAVKAMTGPYRGLYRVPRLSVERVLVEKAVRRGSKADAARATRDFVETLLCGQVRASSPHLAEADSLWKVEKGRR